MKNKKLEDYTVKEVIKICEDNYHICKGCIFNLKTVPSEGRCCIFWRDIDEWSDAIEE